MKERRAFFRGAAKWPFLKWLWGAVVLTIAAPGASAAFIGTFDFTNFTLLESSFADGCWTPVGTQMLMLTGPSDGSGMPGNTDFIMTMQEPGPIAFNFSFRTKDDPTWEYAGYILTDSYSIDCLACFHPLADTDGDSGSVIVPNISQGDVFGFRAGSLDNSGYPGILTVSGINAIPEPSTIVLFLLGSFGLLLRAALKRAGLPRRLTRTAQVVIPLFLALTASLRAQNQNYYFGSNVTGQLTLSGVVNFSQQAQISSRQALGIASSETLKQTAQHALRPKLPVRTASGVVTPSTAPLTISGPSGTGFNALSHMDQRTADGSSQWSIEPPNGNVAVANGYVLEGVNDAVQLFSVTGSPMLPRVVSSNRFFGLLSAIDWITGINGPYLTDMRVYYDWTINRWIVLQRGQDNDLAGNLLASSHLYLAVSKTSDPTGDYAIYTMDTTDATNWGCPCVDDYPQIGADQYGFHVAWNEFNAYDDQTFIGVSVLTISKTSLAAAAPNPVAFQFLIPAGTPYAFSLQPAATPPKAFNYVGNGGMEYFVSSNIYGFDNQVSLWAMYNTSSLALATPNPILVRALVPVLNYGYPTYVTQRPGLLPYGSTLTPPGQLADLDGGDPRVLSVSYAGGRLFVTFQAAVSDQNGTFVDGGAYIVLAPTVRNGVVAASVVSQGYLYVNGNHLLRPSIAVNSQGRGAIAVTLVGPDWFPSAALIPISAASAPTTLQVAAAGTLPEDGFTGYPDYGGVGVARWGDYNCAVADGDGSIWMLMQYIGSFPRTLYANWNTFIARFQP